MSTQAPQTGNRRRGRPARLTQEQIVAAAREIIRDEGVDALTMRHLAKTIGSTPMALYGHVDDRVGLLLLILEVEAQELEWPELPDDPRERIVVAATFIHDILVDRRWALEAAWPGELFGLAVLPLVEEIIASFITCGLTFTAAVHGYRSIWFLITGELRSRYRQPESVARSRLTRVDPETMPQTTRLAASWQETDRSYDIARVIGALVEGLIADDES